MNTRECVKCNNCTVDSSDKAHVKIVCHATGKVFDYGQFVNCNLKNNSGGKSNNLKFRRDKNNGENNGEN